MLDRYQRQDEPCWNDPATNVFHDPFCDTIGAFGDQRAARGGSWGETPAALQAVNRQIGDPDVGGFNLGFRCARPAL